MDKVKTSVEYICSSIGLITSKQCETLLKLKKEISVLTNRLYKNFLEYEDIFDIVQKENSVKNISKVSSLLQEFELTINNPIILKLIYGNIKDKVRVKHRITEIYYDFETIKLLNRLYKDYCDDKKYYDIKHLYDRPCSEAIRLILEITNKNKEIIQMNERVEEIISELKQLLVKNVLELKTKANYPKKEKKEYSTNILNNEYYLLSFYLSKGESIYSFDVFRKYDLLSNQFGNNFNYEYLEGIEYEEDLQEEEKEKYNNLRNNIDQIIEERGDLYSQYLANVSLCFPSKTQEKSKYFYILIDNTNNHVIFSFRIDSFNMIYDLCKTENPLYKDLRMSDLLKVFILKQKSEYYVHLDFNEPNFKNVIALFVRSGFSLKGPTSLPNEFLLDEYSKNKRYLLMSYNPKKTINYNGLNTENLLAISNNIREYETKMKVNYYELENSSIRKILRYLYNWDGEISGSFTRVSNKLKINVLENLDINMNLNNGSEMILTPKFNSVTKDRCEVLLKFYDIMNYHTHPLFCYFYGTKVRQLNSPSRGDLNIILTSIKMYNAVTRDFFKNHLIFALECIYTIQIHPYWIRKFKDKSYVYIKNFFDYLSFLIENFTAYDKTFIALFNAKSKSFVDLLYFYNNKFNFNELSKDTKHLNAKELTEHPSSLTKEEEIRQWYKAKYYSSDLDRNMNLLSLSIIPYNWREGSDLSKLSFTEVPNHMTEYLKVNGDQISKLTKYVQDNLSDETIKIPYHFF